MRTWPSLTLVWRFWEILSVSLINSAEVWKASLRVGGSSLWLTSVVSDTRVGPHSLCWFSWSKSHSGSESENLPGFSEASLKQWSMCRLNTFRSFVSTLLKHTGQLRLSDTLLPHPDVVATALVRGGQLSTSNRLAADPSTSLRSGGGSAPALSTGRFSFISCSFSLRAWALWKKDCWGSPSHSLASEPFSFLQRGSSSAFWAVWTGSGQASGLVWAQLLPIWSSWCFRLTGVESSGSVLPCWRKPMMLFCRGFLSSELTNAEILTPASAEEHIKPRRAHRRLSRFILSLAQQAGCQWFGLI